MNEQTHDHDYADIIQNLYFRPKAQFDENA